MERIPEPELMFADSALAYAQADFSVPHDGFVRLFSRCLPGPVTGAVLDLGCGPGDIAIRFARAFPEVSVVGVDGSEDMLTLGRQAVTAAGLAQRIVLRHGLIPDMGLPRNGFDTILCNSLLHHLSRPEALWESVWAHVRPGGRVFVMDLMRPHSRADAERLRELYSAGDPPVLQQDFFNSLLASYRPDEVAAQLRGTPLSDLKIEVVSDRHFVVHGRAPEVKD